MMSQNKKQIRQVCLLQLAGSRQAMRKIIQIDREVVAMGSEQQSVSVDAVPDYRELYLQTLQKLTQLSTISSLLSGTFTKCSQIQLTSIVSQHQKNILLLEQQLKHKYSQYSLLQTKLKQQQSLFDDRQQCLKQKLQVELRRKNLILDQLELVRVELRLGAKEMMLVEGENARLKDMVNKQYEYSTHSQQYDQPHSSGTILNDSLRQLLKQQQNEIHTLQTQVNRLESVNEQILEQMTKLQQKITSIEQLHRLESLAKVKCIQTLQREITLREEKLSRMMQTHTNESLSQLTCEDNANHTMSYQQHQRQVRDSLRVIHRLQVKISQYEALISSYEENEQRIYMQLMSKDMRIQECEQNNTQLLKKIHLLQSVIDELKISRITAELQKDQIVEKYRKSRKVSRLSNLSIAKHEQTQKTAACETTFTRTPTSSLGNSQLQLNCSSLDHSLPNDAKNNKSCLTTKNKCNEVKSSFIKNNNTKTLSRKYSQVTPFEI